jgi:cytochrome c-type biogenesis protein CcmH
MTLFWVFAALLLCVALAFLITPLLRSRAAGGGAASRAEANLAVFRDQLAELDADLAAGSIGRDQWEAARADLERGLLQDVETPAGSAAAPAKRSKVAAIAVGIALPLASVLLYLALGNPQGVDPIKAAGDAGGAPHQVTREQIESMATRLAQRLESEPGDAAGWAMLARTYGALGRFGEASSAYAKASALFPEDAQLLADYADALAMAQGRRLQGKPEALIQRALRADGNNLKVLALAGSVEFEKNNFAKAVEYWNRMLPLLPPDSDMGNSVRASIQEAQGKLGGAPVPVAKSAPGAAPNNGSVSGTVKLAPALSGRAAAEDTVFVFARAAQGPRAPLAVLRVKVKDLPLTFSLDDSMAMNPSSKLSDYPEVVVVARVSKSGTVVPQPGDLEGSSKPLRPGTKGINIEVASEVK